MKFTGAQIKQFWDAWPMGKDWYHDGAEISFEAESSSGDSYAWALEPAGKYDSNHLGGIFWQGEFTCAPSRLELGEGVSVPVDVDSGSVEFGRALSAWLKAQKVAVVVVEVHKEQLDEFKAVCKTRGWKVT